MNKYISAVKIRIVPLNKNTFDYINNLMYQTNKIYNDAYSHEWVFIKQKLSESIIPVKSAKTTKVYHSVRDLHPTFPTAILSNICHRVKKDFSNDIKNGLFKGKRTPRLYKYGAPIIYQFNSGGINPNFHNVNDDIILRIKNGLDFKLLFGKDKSGNKKLLERLMDKNDKSLNINRVFNVTYNKRDKHYYIIFTYETESEDYEKVKGRVCGIDLGVRRFVSIRLNDNIHVQKSIHSDDLIRVKMDINKKRREYQKSMVMAKGGHGRNRKLKYLDTIRKKEINFTNTALHKLSKQVIDFCIKYKVEQINMELLNRNIDKNSFFSRYWPISNFIDKLKYKVDSYGINLKFVDPYHTSQICSICGEIGERNGDTFICQNDKCKIHNENIDSDYNAAYNIAKSKLYVDKYENTQYYKLKNKEKVL